MSKATKRKYVTKEVLCDYATPEGSQEIVKVIAGRGNNLHEVQSANGSNFLASMPTKFRKNIWIKRGDYIIIEPIKEGDKVKAEIVRILYKDQIKYIKKEGLWPKEFEANNTLAEINVGMKNLNSKESCSESSDNDDDLFVNTNHANCYAYDSSDSCSTDDDVDDDGVLCDNSKHQINAKGSSDEGEMYDHSPSMH